MSLKTKLSETHIRKFVEQILNNKISLPNAIYLCPVDGTRAKSKVVSLETKEDLNTLASERVDIIGIGGTVARLQTLNNVQSVFGDRFIGDEGFTFIRLPNGWRYAANDRTYCNQCALLALGLPPEEAKAISIDTRKHLHNYGGIAIDDAMWEWIAYSIRRRIITYERNVNGSIYQVVHGAGLSNGTEVRKVFLEGNHYEPLLTPEQTQEWIQNDGWYGKQQ